MDGTPGTAHADQPTAGTTEPTVDIREEAAADARAALLRALLEAQLSDGGVVAIGLYDRRGALRARAGEEGSLPPTIGRPSRPSNSLSAL